MKTIAIFPVTFARVEEIGGDYVAMNMTEFHWPMAFGWAASTTADQASKIFRKFSS